MRHLRADDDHFHKFYVTSFPKTLASNIAKHGISFIMTEINFNSFQLFRVLYILLSLLEACTCSHVTPH